MTDVKKIIENGIETYEAEINGERIHWDAGLTYAAHIKTKELLGTQNIVSDQPEEMLFVIMHQSMELWIKLILHEAKRTVEFIREDKLQQAFKLLDRIATIQRHMIHSWEVLATLSPTDFMSFRGYLRKASGFQSYQYRELEFLLGNKNADLVIVHQEDPEIYDHLMNTLNAPSLYDEVLQLLAQRGFTIPQGLLERDWAQPYEAEDAVEKVWQEIYENSGDNWELYTLGEKITALEYYFQEWRFKHMKTVSRVIGYKRGTGGSSGVSYLVKALDLSFFPELWSMRTKMVAPVAGAHA